MMRSFSFSRAASLLAALAVCGGCSQSPGGSKTAGADATETAPAATVTIADSEVEAALAKLPEADRDAARQQKLCPVSDHALGSMGPPIKVAHEGQEAFLCCEGCKEEFEKYPTSMLAKLKK